MTISTFVIQKGYNPDEAIHLYSLNNTINSLKDYNQQFKAHLSPAIQFYVISRLFHVDMTLFQLIAGMTTIFSLLYTIYIALSYKLFDKFSLLACIAVIVINQSIYQFGVWGIFTYSQRILISVAFLHLILFLNKHKFILSTRFLILLSIFLCINTASNAAFLMPTLLVISVVAVNLLIRDYFSNNLSKGSQRVILKNVLILGLPVLIMGLITLLYFTHEEFRNPRADLLWMYFPQSDCPASLYGALYFIYTHTISFVKSVTEPHIIIRRFLPINEIVIFFGFSFFIGMVRSFFLRSSARFLLALYMLLSIVSLILLSLVGINPFGNTRYALFIHIPLLMLAGLGISDIFKAAFYPVSKLIGKLSKQTVLLPLKYFCFAVLAIAFIFIQYNFIMHKSTDTTKFNKTYSEIINFLRNDKTPMLIYDYYSGINLKHVGIDISDKTTFFFDRSFLRKDAISSVDFDEYLDLLNKGKDILSVTYFPFGTEWYSKYALEIRNRYTPVKTFDINRWRVILWKRSPHILTPVASYTNGIYQNSHSAKAAFDGDKNTMWHSPKPPGTLGWLAVRFPHPVRLMSLTMTIRRNMTSQAPVEFVIEGSDDNRNWTHITEIENLKWRAGETKTITVHNSSKFYTYYKFDFTKNKPNLKWISIVDMILFKD